MTAQEAVAKIKNVSRACHAVGCMARKVGNEPTETCQKNGCMSPDFPVKKVKQGNANENG